MPKKTCNKKSCNKKCDCTRKRKTRKRGGGCGGNHTRKNMSGGQCGRDLRKRGGGYSELVGLPILGPK